MDFLRQRREAEQQAKAAHMKAAPALPGIAPTSKLAEGLWPDAMPKDGAF